MIFSITEWSYAIIMAIVQGITEFIPVSSSGHLSIVEMFFDVNSQAAIDFYFFLHIPTFIAAVAYFRNDIRDFALSMLPSAINFSSDTDKKASEESSKEAGKEAGEEPKTSLITWKYADMTPQRKIVAALIISMLVTGPMGLLLSGHLAEFSSHLIVLGAMFIVTALMLVSSEYVLVKSKLQHSMDKLTFTRAAFIGFIQGLAVIPGISRSGSAIAAGLWMGLSREQATRYSFLLFIPIMIAGSLRDFVRMAKGDLILPSFWTSVVSFVVAGVIGYLVIAGMIKLVSKTSLNYFAVYAAILGTVLIVLYFI